MKVVSKALTVPVASEGGKPWPGYSEQSFNRILELERKRSERSKRGFALMLLALDGPAEEIADIGERIFSSLAATKREIDVLGWYRQDLIAGVILTEISGGSGSAPIKSIAARVKARLALELGPDEVKRVRIGFRFFPEKPDGLVLPGDLTLYPDIRQRLDSHEKGLWLKRVLDIFGALAALVVLSPVFLIFAAMIKLGSKGPVFFRQQRVGQCGRMFTFLKFRSMYVDSDPSPHMEYTKSLILGEAKAADGGERLFKLRDDPRITRLGRFLRSTSLDEIPQFLKVLTGEMSLVGPRPPIPYEVENYDPWHWRRVLEMKPGITGIWQVSGRSRTTFDEMVRLDIHYMTHWSLWLDLKLIFKTPLAVLSGKGAY